MVPLAPQLKTRRNQFVGKAPPVELLPHHRLLIEYIVNGCPHRLLCNRQGVPIGQPLALEQAADIIGIRRRHARFLAAQPIFQAALAKANAALRSGAHTKAIHRMIHLIDEPGEGKASDHKVQLDAARAVLGEDQATANNPRVSVSIHNTVQTPGYVIDYEPDLPTVIDVEPNQ